MQVVPFSQALRVPLDSQDERVLLALNALDDAIFSRGIDDQTLAGFPYRLVMGSIDLQVPAPHDLPELGAVVDSYFMAASFF